MTINFNVQNPRTGASTAALNESRVDRILNASTLAEAQRMGVFDKLKDWCRGRQGGCNSSDLRPDFGAPTQ